ncbi:hypothetical protein MANES_01G019801v8 [Manihot esculenta]|uniref:Uncharacterized protein n=1 Tax=Manihot esculenta TaxID=3983 RepID=A0A2C9WJB0_MANES|nr:hypothetical protein MANES_01G019801v8 [Manihot esculenta]
MPHFFSSNFRSLSWLPLPLLLPLAVITPCHHCSSVAVVTPCFYCCHRRSSAAPLPSLCHRLSVISLSSHLHLCCRHLSARGTVAPLRLVLWLLCLPLLL